MGARGSPPHSQSPSCCLCPVPAEVPPRKTPEPPWCGELGTGPQAPLILLLGQGCGNRALTFPMRSRLHSELGSFCASWDKVLWRAASGRTTRLLQLSSRAALDGCPPPTHHVPISGTGPQVPEGVQMLSEPTASAAGAGSPLPPSQLSEGNKCSLNGVPWTSLGACVPSG